MCMFSAQLSFSYCSHCFLGLNGRWSHCHTKFLVKYKFYGKPCHQFISDGVNNGNQTSGRRHDIVGPIFHQRDNIFTQAPLIQWPGSHIPLIKSPWQKHCLWHTASPDGRTDGICGRGKSAIHLSGHFLENTIPAHGLVSTLWIHMSPYEQRCTCSLSA